MREHIKDGIKRAQAVLIIGEDSYNLSSTLPLPCFKGKIFSYSPQLENNRVVAFAGIGRPQKFYTSLQELGIEIIKTFDFPDHHYYTNDELQNILDIAKENKAQAITTSKDFVKIPNSLKEHFKVLNIGIQWEKTEELQEFIVSQIKRK